MPGYHFHNAKQSRRKTMFKPIPVNVKGVVAFKAVGKLTHDDYQRFLPTLEAILREEGPISLLLELENFHGWELEAAKDDYEFARTHLDSFRRIAIIGDRGWERWLALMAKPFTDIKVRFFTRDQLTEAWDWVREPFLEEEEARAFPRPWKNILAPVDFSPHAERSVKRAAALARENDATLTLLHVVEDFVLYDDFYDPVMPMTMEYEDALLEAASQRLAEWVRELDLGNPGVEVILGSAAGTILSYAEAQEVDLIVMGSHGRKGLSRLLGSTTRSILNRARCEVLSVPLF
jgi:universal stress protein A